MIIRKTLIAALACFSMSAAAEFTTVELAYEIRLSNLNVPVSSSSALIFKTCGNCEYKKVRMTRDTRYVVNGENVGLKEFRKRVFQVRDRDAETIIVRHHLESDVITALQASL